MTTKEKNDFCEEMSQMLDNFAADLAERNIQEYEEFAFRLSQVLYSFLQKEMNVKPS